MGGGDASPGVAGSGGREGGRNKASGQQNPGPRKHSTTEGEVGDVWGSKVIISRDYLL